MQVGGPLGAFLPETQFDTPLDYEAFAAIDGMIGHGGVVAFDDTVDMAQMARYAMEFCAIESCGKCTPCRIGSTRGVEVIDRIVADEGRAKNLTLLRDLCDTMLHGSLCALGGMTPFPVLSALKHFPEDFGKPRAARQAAERRARTRASPTRDAERIAESSDHVLRQRTRLRHARPAYPSSWSRSRSTACR